MVTTLDVDRNALAQRGWSLKCNICWHIIEPTGAPLLHCVLHSTHQVCAEHEEADEVDVGQVAPAAELFSGLSVRFWVTASARQRCQHNLLPLLPGGTPTSTHKESATFI